MRGTEAKARESKETEEKKGSDSRQISLESHVSLRSARGVKLQKLTAFHVLLRLMVSPDTIRYQPAFARDGFELVYKLCTEKSTSGYFFIIKD